MVPEPSEPIEVKRSIFSEPENEKTFGNLRTPENVAETPSEPVVEEEKTQDPKDFTPPPLPGKQDAPAPVIEKDKPQPAETASDAFDPFNVLQTRLSTEESKYEIPEWFLKGVKEDGTKISNDERFDVLVQEIIRNTDVEALVSQNDPFLAEYLQNRRTEGFSAEEFLKSFVQDTVEDKRPNKDILYDYYKSVGYNDTDINEALDRMTKIEIDERAEGVKRFNQSKAQEKRAKLVEENRAKSTQAFEQSLAQEEQLLNGVIDSYKPTAEIGGIPHTPEVQREFQEYLRYMALPDKQTGQRPINMLLSNGRELYKMLFAYHALQSQKIADFLSVTKESVKRGTFDKLDIGPESKSTGSSKPYEPPRKGSFSS